MEKKIPLLSYGPWPQAAQHRPAPSPPRDPLFFFLRAARSSFEVAQLRGPAAATEAASTPSLPLPPTDRWTPFVRSVSYLITTPDSPLPMR